MLTYFFSILHKFIPFVLKVISTFIAYNLVVVFFDGLSIKWSQFLLEVPLIIISTGCFYFAIKQTYLRTWVSMIPWLLFYSIVDVYYILFGRVFKLNEFNELPEMYDILPTYFTVCSLILSAFLLWLFFRNVQLKRIGLLITGFVPVAITAGVSYFIPMHYIKFLEHTSDSIQLTQEYEQTSTNGRLITLLYYEAKRRNALMKLDHPESWEDIRSEQKIAQLHSATKRNVHIIVMESFLDPTLLKKLPSIQQYIPEFFTKIDNQKSWSQSPVFGNRTPQAEFEILCNVPAFQQVSVIEFNVFSGAPTSCLPAWFKKAGWHTTATHAYKPSFFNRSIAYKGLQFDDIYFAKEYAPDAPSYFETRLDDDIQFMYDGDLFEQNIKFIERHIQNHPDTPLFNYMLGVYGHWPNLRDKVRFPDIITLDLPDHNEEMQNIVNEYLYRMIALEKHIKQLYKIDPNSLVLVISDHLPPMKGMTDVYTQLEYLPEQNNNTFVNIFYLFDHGKIVDTDGVYHHYQMADLIASRLNNIDCFKPKCLQQRETKNLIDDYEHVISAALQENEIGNLPL